MALTNDDIAALSQMMDNLLSKKLSALGLVSEVPSPTNGHVDGAVKLAPTPVVTVVKTPTVSAPQVKEEVHMETINELPMTPLLGVTGQALVDLAKLGAGEYGPQGNLIFGAMREHILNSQKPPTTYKLLSGPDKTKLNEYITKKLTERVNAIRKILKAQKAQETLAVTTAPVLELPEEEDLKPGEFRQSATNSREATYRPHMGNVSLPTPEVADEDRYETINPRPTSAESIGPVGDAEVRKLVEEAREGIKIGQSPIVTLTQWAKKESNQKRPGIAKKILAAAAKELQVNLKG